MNIRPILRSEVDDVSRIVEQNYSREYADASKKEVDAMFHNPTVPPRYLVAEDEGKVIGFAGYSQSWMDYHIYQIFWVNVDSHHQGRGIGTSLVSKVIEEIKATKGAEMIQLTTTKPEFYEKFGFRTLTRFGEKEHSLMVLKLR